MNWRTSRPIRQITAVGLFVALLLATWSLLVHPALTLASDRIAEIESLSNKLTGLQSVIGRRPLYERRAEAVKGMIESRNLLWSGSSNTAVAASIQDLVRAAATESGGQMVSASEMGAMPESGLLRLTVRFRIEGTIDTLVRVLGATEAARPMLFVDNLVVSASEGGFSHDHPPEIAMELAVAGYLRMGP